MADRIAENGAIQYALANPEAGSKRAGLSGYIMGALEDWLKNPVPPLSRLSAPGRLRGKFFDSGIAPLAMDFANQQFYSNQSGVMEAKSFSDIVNFTRTSNATVTRADGTIGYAPHNLLTHSEQFDNVAWTKVNVFVTANNITAPDGTLTADKVVRNNGATGAYLSRVSLPASIGDGAATINLITGAISNLNLWTTSNVSTVLISNGWVRIIVSIGGYSLSYYAKAGENTSLFFQVAGTTLYIYPYTTGTGNGVDGVYIWGAQLEIGSTATTYNPTTVKNLLGFSESFDNAAWTKSNSFVQTNLLTYSEAFDNAAWGKAGASITVNTVIAPNGYQTADKLVEDTSTGGHQFTHAAVLLSAVAYTYSIYAKAAERNWIRTSIQGNYTYFDVLNGVVGTNAAGNTATIEAVGNGWYRCSITRTATAANNFGLIGLANADNSASYTGDGTSGIYIWGAQLVQGSVAGDYRRTDAAALPIFYPNHNGVVCAQKLVENTVLTNHQLFQVVNCVSGTPYTFSFYSKAAERTEVQFFGAGGLASIGGRVNLANGQVIAGAATVKDVGNGWWRISGTGASTFTGANQVYIVISNNGTSNYTGDGTSGIYIFGAQLSDSASLDPYVLNAGAAPSSAAFYGARFDHDPVTLEPKGLLIEEQRTNLLLNSSLAGTNLATQNVTVTAVAHTLSFYGTGEITLSGTATATLTGTGAYPSRATLTFTPTAGTLTVTVSGTVQFAQLEAGAFATSYIPTAASQVTRTADVATIQGSNFYSWINANEGSMLTNFDWLGPSAFDTMFAIGADANNNTFLGLNSSNVQRMVNTYVGTTDMNQIVPPAVGITANTYYKLAGSYKINDYAVVSNNGTVLTDTSATPPIYNQSRIGQNVDGTNGFNGHIKSISYYSTRLSNDVLRGLTA